MRDQDGVNLVGEREAQPQERVQHEANGHERSRASERRATGRHARGENAAEEEMKNEEIKSEEYQRNGRGNGALNEDNSSFSVRLGLLYRDSKT